MDTIFVSNQTDDSALVIWTALLTIATLLLAIVAVFQDRIRVKVWGPELDIVLNVSSPHCHVATTIGRIQNSMTVYPKKWLRYYFRFQIFNNGHSSAKNVEVILKDVTNGKDESMGLPLDNLLWSTLYLTESGNYVPRMYWESISPKTYQYCNLGHVSEPELLKISPDELNEKYNLEEYECLFSFNVYWKTNDKRHIIEKGTYKFEVIVGCANGKPVNKKFKMVFDGHWYDDENEMLTKGIRIEEFKI